LKQKQLKSYENIKKKKQKKDKEDKKKQEEAEKKALTATNAAQPTKKSSSFATKVTEKVLNNLQVRINNVHCRYEDASNPEVCNVLIIANQIIHCDTLCYSVKNKILLGITLKDLVLESCDNNWERKILKEMLSCVYKLAELKGLSVYMERNDDINFQNAKTPDEFKRLMQKSVRVCLTRVFVVIRHYCLNNLLLNSKK